LRLAAVLADESTQNFDDDVEHVRSVIAGRGASVDIQLHPTRH